MSICRIECPPHLKKTAVFSSHRPPQLVFKKNPALDKLQQVYRNQQRQKPDPFGRRRATPVEIEKAIRNGNNGRSSPNGKNTR